MNRGYVGATVAAIVAFFCLLAAWSTTDPTLGMIDAGCAIIMSVFVILATWTTWDCNRCKEMF